MLLVDVSGGLSQGLPFSSHLLVCQSHISVLKKKKNLDQMLITIDCGEGQSPQGVLDSIIQLQGILVYFHI